MSGSLVGRLRARLNRGDSVLTWDVGRLLSGDGLDETAFEDLEARMLGADAGVAVTGFLTERLRLRVRQGKARDAAALRRALVEALTEILAPCAHPLSIPAQERPFVILGVGVNGVGKTTTLGKLALRLKQAGHSVLLAAGDTFRAAAIDQLRIWADRAGVPLVAQAPGADPASVVYDAVAAAGARGADVVLADTAGRLHTQGQLMEELRKVQRVVRKLDPAAPHEVLLVVDATTGGNALAQARQFHQALGLTGIAVTKLDGSARGGTVLAIARELGVPIRFIGVGEAVEDLLPFDAAAYAEALVGEERG